MSVAIDCFAPVNSVLGEGPVWDERTGTLYWVDIKAPALFATEVAARQTRRWPMPERIGAIGLREGNGLVGAFKSGFALIDLPAGTVRPIVDPEPDRPGNRFNDGKVDPRGRFWAGSMDDEEREPTGHLYRLDPDRSVERFEIGFICTNGIDWSGDGRTLYFTDTFERRINAYDFDIERGHLGTRRTFAEVPEGRGFPDGLTVFDGYGQWRNPASGVIGRSPRVKIVLIAVKRAPDLEPRLSAVIDAYKTRFRQQSVGLITRDSCAAFN